MILLTFAVILGFSTPLYAANDRIGNGGDVVVCRTQDGKIQSVELLDFYEGRELRGMIPRKVDPTKSWREIFEVWITELQSSSPLRAKRYRIKFESLLKDADFRAADLTDVPDSEHLIFEEGCAVRQIAIQQDGQKKFPEDRMLLVDQRLWEAMDPLNQAGLMLHEVIMHEAREALHTDSTAVRYFTTAIAAGKLLKLKTDKERLLFYRDQIRFLKSDSSTGFEISLNGISSYGRPQPTLEPISSMEFYPNGKLKAGPIHISSFGKSVQIPKLGEYLELTGSKGRVFVQADRNAYGGIIAYLDFRPDGSIHKAWASLLYRSKDFDAYVGSRYHAIFRADLEIACLGFSDFGADRNGKTVTPKYRQANGESVSLDFGYGFRFKGGKAFRLPSNRDGSDLTLHCPEAK